MTKDLINSKKILLNYHLLKYAKCTAINLPQKLEQFLSSLCTPTLYSTELVVVVVYGTLVEEWCWKRALRWPP